MTKAAEDIVKTPLSSQADTIKSNIIKTPLLSFAGTQDAKIENENLIKKENKEQELYQPKGYIKYPVYDFF